MNKSIITVPRGIRYISEWSSSQDGYGLEKYPFPHIVDKKITGCGFTEYCLMNNLDVIVCSPRKILLENKEDQHSGEVFYFKNEFFEVDQVNFDQDISAADVKVAKSEISKVIKEKEASSEVATDRYYILKCRLLDYMSKCRDSGKPIKVLVTYDSFHLVRDFIQSSDHFIINNFYVVIDEFQSIFTDSRFKSNTELGFVKVLHGLDNLCFVSATPMLDHYLEQLEEFKDLPYFEFDWKTEDPSRVIKPAILVHASRNLMNDAKEIIRTYLDGEYECYSYTDPLGRICKIESKEAVLYFNSVKNICDLIKKCKLTPENTNVLCSTSPANQALIKKAFKTSCGAKDGSIGVVPKRGESHKMFTLCTRTVYLGADFYSTCARSFIFSDPNIDCLAVDISLDLPQILGRQRLDENPWKNRATLYYTTTRDGKKLTKEVFDAKVKEKQELTSTLIRATDRLLDDPRTRDAVLTKYEVAAKLTHYSSDYLAIDHGARGELIPVLNNLVMVAEMRAFDIQQVDYRDRFSVFNSLVIGSDVNTEKMVDEYLAEFDSRVRFTDKLEYLCSLIIIKGMDGIGSLLEYVPLSFRNYIILLGPERCKALKYRKSDVDGEIDRLLNNQNIDITSDIISKFEIGRKYSLIEIKEYLTNLYEAKGFKSSPKATDLSKYFELRAAKLSAIVDGEKKMVRAFEILSIKDDNKGENL